jgi:type IV secretion system protein TrbL
MNPQSSTLIQALLGDLSSASSTWYDTLFPYARLIFFTLVGFQLLWTSLTFALGKRQGDEFIAMLFILVIDVGFFYALMLNPDWIIDIINSFRQIGSEAGRVSRLTPDAVIDTGLRLSSAIIKTVSITGLVDFAVAIFVSALVAIAVLGSFAFIAARMVLILAEVFFAVNVGPLLLAFSGLSATKYIATQYIGYVLSSGIQLIVMYLLIGAGLDLATGWADMIIEHGSKDVNAFMLVGVASCLYSVLVWNLPKLIGGLASGAPQMVSGGYGATAAGFGAGLQVTRGGIRGVANSFESTATLSKATAQNYGARRELGSSQLGSLGNAGLVSSAAALSKGANSLLGRYNRPSASDRINSSTAKIKVSANNNNAKEN